MRNQRLACPYSRARRLTAGVPKAWRDPRVLLAASAAFVLTMLAVPLLGTDLIPQLAQDRFEMTAKLPPGTPLAQADALIRDVQARHAKDDGVRVLYGVSGTGTRLDASPTESGENIGKLSVVMTDNDAEGPLTEALRTTMQAYPQAQVDSAAGKFSVAPAEIEAKAPTGSISRPGANSPACCARIRIPEVKRPSSSASPRSRSASTRIARPLSA